MGVRHIEGLGKHLQAEAKGRYYVTQSEPPYDGWKDKKDRKYQLRTRKDGEILASMTIQSLPGCCGVVVFYNFSGEAKEVAKFIQIGYAAAQRAGYGAAIVTLRSGSKIFESLLAEGNHLFEFLNGKTGNSVTLYCHLIDQVAKRPSDTESE
jgi:hypothetical protein